MKKKLITNTKIYRQNKSEVVTKTYLTAQGYITKSEFDEFGQAVVTLFDDQREQFERNIGVMVEGFKSEVRMLAEALKMRIETSERKWEEQNKKNNIFMTQINELRIKHV